MILCQAVVGIIRKANMHNFFVDIEQAACTKPKPQHVWNLDQACGRDLGGVVPDPM